MTELLLVIIIVQLGFVLNRLHKKGDSAKESVFDRFEREQKGNAVFVASQLRELHGCACAFTLWAPGRIFADESPSTQGRGIILDSDDEWVLIECPAPFGAKGATQRLFRIADIASDHSLSQCAVCAERAKWISCSTTSSPSNAYNTTWGIERNSKTKRRLALPVRG